MKKYRTRKQKALRRALLIAALVAVLSLTDAVNFLPRQAVQDMAQGQNIKNAEVVRSFYDGELKVYRFARQYFVEGEDALMLCAVGFDPLMGWYDRDWCVVDTADGNVLHTGYRGHQQGEAYTGYLFGRVDDKRADRVVVRWEYHESDEIESLELPETAFFDGEGSERYFLMKAESFDAEDARWFSRMTTCAYDTEGKLLGETEVIWHEWGSGS